jgi:enoyl-CoA hydratase/carnithine racemase
MNPTFFTEISQVFRKINQSETVRAVVLQAEGKLFTAGLDLKEAAGLGVFNQDSEGKIVQYSDPSRSAIKIYQVIRDLQQAFLDVYNCRVPVVVGINGLCIGGGIDLVCMADIRYCTKDA